MAGKPMTQTDNLAVRAAFNSLSKGALADLALHLLRQHEAALTILTITDRGQVRGERVVGLLRESFAPVAKIRGDRPLAPVREYRCTRTGRVGWQTSKRVGPGYELTGRVL